MSQRFVLDIDGGIARHSSSIDRMRVGGKRALALAAPRAAA